jgi:hypothetical protein
VVCPPKVDSQKLVAKVNASQVVCVRTYILRFVCVRTYILKSPKFSRIHVHFHMGIAEHKRECTPKP